MFCVEFILSKKYVTFFICPIAGKERKAIFAKPFEKRISEGKFLKSAVNFDKKRLDLY